MNKNLEGLKLVLCQMKVVPGRPDLNTAYIVSEIQAAAKRGVDIIVFPEMCVTGYFIGDKYEDDAFLNDVKLMNRKICEATNAGITAIVGTLVHPPNTKGEDGFPRVMNSAVVYQNGRYVGHAVKTLQPNYRMFDDDRHFFSTRKLALHENKNLEDLINPFEIKMPSGKILKIGVMLCEDMWHESYSLNPAKILAERGAEILFNLSASPWTWQKNRKRHQIVKKLIGEINVPFAYVNNTGIQNVGKNIIIFDGSSTLYSDAGEGVFEIPPYADGSHDVTLTNDLKPLAVSPQDDAKELYLAMRSAISEFFAALPLGRRKIVIGISGGIDSALTSALYADALGSANVVGINMPSKFNSQKTKDIAKAIADNLGIAYDVRPIQEVVDVIAKATDVSEGSLAHENIQARVRMEILAARSQDLGCMFSANWNKVEAAFGYGTLYGDMAGVMALIGDLVKREVYQLADYLNREVYKREVIPQECFDIAPTAELALNQKDPFDYGRLNHRGYHEEMVRAFVEFRKNPEWFLESYLKGTLEKELMLESGRLKGLFPSNRDFVRDLEKHWRMFSGAYFKRVQGAPIPIVSKRAFGFDFRESMMSPHFTARYHELKATILSKDAFRAVIYGGSFNPPALHHRQIVMRLREWFDEVIVVPSGIRKNKDSLMAATIFDRRELVKFNFADIPNVTICDYDLEHDVFTPTYALYERYKADYQDKEVWYAVGADLVIGGAKGESEIQRLWIKGHEVWNNLNFAVITRVGFNLRKEDLPPHAEVIDVDFVGASTNIRELIAKGEDVSPFVKKEVNEYIKEKKLYGGGATTC